MPPRGFVESLEGFPWRTRLLAALVGGCFSQTCLAPRRARRPAGGPVTARKTSKVRRWGGGVSEISRRRPRRGGRIQRRRHRKRTGLGTKSAGSDAMEKVMRHATMVGALRHATGSPILTLPRFRKDGTLARMGLGFAERRHFLVMRSTADTDKFVPRSDARLWACHAPMVTGCRLFGARQQHFQCIGVGLTYRRRSGSGSVRDDVKGPRQPEELRGPHGVKAPASGHR